MVGTRLGVGHSGRTPGDKRSTVIPRLVPAVLCLSLIGCQGLPNQELESDVAERTHSAPIEIPVGDGPHAGIIKEVLGERLPHERGPDQGGTDFAAQVFADGKVDFAEYEAAMFHTVACVAAEGYEVDGPLRFPDGFLVLYPGVDPRVYLTYQVIAPPDSNTQADIELSAVMETCDVEWRWWVEQSWLRQHVPTEAEVQRWLDRAWECAREREYEIGDPPSVDDDLMSVVFPGSGCQPWLEE